MQNSIKRFILSAIFMVGFVGVGQAQVANDCNNVSEEAKQSCFEKLVTYNLSELIEYPADAKFDGKEGKVVVRFTTDENNQIQNIRVLGKPDQQLSEAVIAAVKKLAEQDHKEMILANTVYRIPVNFALR